MPSLPPEQQMRWIMREANYIMVFVNIALYYMDCEMCVWSKLGLASTVQSPHLRSYIELFKKFERNTGPISPELS